MSRWHWHHDGTQCLNAWVMTGSCTASHACFLLSMLAGLHCVVRVVVQVQQWGSLQVHEVGGGHWRRVVGSPRPRGRTLPLVPLRPPVCPTGTPPWPVWSGSGPVLRPCSGWRTCIALPRRFAGKAGQCSITLFGCCLPVLQREGSFVWGDSVCEYGSWVRFRTCPCALHACAHATCGQGRP